MGTLENQPAWLQQEVYTRIFDACKISGYDNKKLEQHPRDMYDEKLKASEIKTAKRIGFEKGLAEGMNDAIRRMAVAETVEGEPNAQLLLQNSNTLILR